MSTNFDLIKSLNIDEMAGLLTDLLHERDVMWLEKLQTQGIDSSLVELPREVQIEIHKQFLLENASNL